jgi:hypothetical protein
MLGRYVLITVFCLAATFLLARCDDYSNASSSVAWCLPELVALFAAAIAMLNALLLYETLKSQNTNFERQKYESTFFNLLDSHQKLTDGLKVQDQTLNLSLHKYTFTINGRQFFSFAMNEVDYILKSLKGQDYRYGFNEEDEQRHVYEREQWQQSQQEPYSPKKEEQENLRNYEDCLVKLTNDKYLITEEEWNQKHSSKPSMVEAFLIFERHWGGFCDHYIRSIKQLLSYTQKQGEIRGLKGDAEYYVHFITAMMTHDETRFIKLYCSSHKDENKDLCELIESINKK